MIPICEYVVCARSPVCVLDFSYGKTTTTKNLLDFIILDILCKFLKRLEQFCEHWTLYFASIADERNSKSEM